MLIVRHRVPATAFTLLSHGYADAAVMGLLRSGRLSKQILLIRAVLDAAWSQSGAVAAAGLEAAVGLLDEIQRSAPAAASRVLGYPLVGAWAAHCLRRLRHPEPSHTPLWVDLGHLAAVAAAAGIQAGADLHLPVPMRHGAVPLPGLGRACLPSDASWGVATVRGGAGSYTVEGTHGVAAVTDEATPGWEPVHRLTVTTAGHSLSIRLDDVDPFRSSHGLPAAGRLRPGAVAAWRADLAEAWQLLVHEHPDRVAELSAGPIVIVPAVRGSESHTNATARDSPGAMTLTAPSHPFQLALSMVHELQHTKLGALLDLVQLYDPDQRYRYYSPWRADPRPVGGLLQGAYAFLAVTRFWYRYASRSGEPVAHRLAEYELARGRGQVHDALQGLAGSGALTEPGYRFVTGLREAVDGLADHAVDARPDRLARLIREDHRVTWRLRNLRMDAEALDQLVAAWRNRAARPAGRPPSRLVRGAPTSYGEEPRHELARRLVEGEYPPPGGPDAALLAGDYEQAAQGYLAGLATEPGRLELWSGLATARQLSPAAPGAYRTEPEVLAALHQRLAAAGEIADPDTLAAWLSP